MSEKMAIVEAIMQANAAKDHETFLSHFVDDVEYHYHVGTRPLLGKDWLRKFVVNYASITSDVEWRVDRHAETEDCLFIEGYEGYTDLRSGERIAHPYMGIIEFEDGKVTKWRDYFEMDQTAD